MLEFDIELLFQRLALRAEEHVVHMFEDSQIVALNARRVNVPDKDTKVMKDIENISFD